MTIVDELRMIEHDLDQLFNRAADLRDAIHTPNKTKWRRVARRLERGLNHIEAAITEAERI